MSNKKSKKKEIPRRQMLMNIATTIKHLETLIDLSKNHPAENFLQKEIYRLKSIKKHMERNGKSN